MLENRYVAMSEAVNGLSSICDHVAPSNSVDPESFELALMDAATCDGRLHPFLSVDPIRAKDLGVAQVSLVRIVSRNPHWSARPLCQCDRNAPRSQPRACGRDPLRTDHEDALPESHDLLIYRIFRRCLARTVAGEDADRGLVVVIPRRLLPFSAKELERLAGMPLSAQEGIGALLSGFLTRLALDGGQYMASDARRVGAVLVNLVIALLAHELDVHIPLPLESGKRALLLEIAEFVEKNLADPELSPKTIAVAHHISIRSLHRLFETQDTTVAEWIRSRRLDHCRRDLSQAQLRAETIATIASRWGFKDGAQFSRWFRATYGIGPRDWRAGKRVGSQLRK